MLLTSTYYKYTIDKKGLKFSLKTFFYINKSMFGWLKSFGSEFCTRWKRWHWPTKIGVIAGMFGIAGFFVAIISLFVGIGIGIGQSIILEEILDLEKAKIPNLVPTMTVGYRYTGAELIDFCENDKYQRCSVLQEPKADQNYQAFSFHVSNLGTSAEGVSIEINPHGQTRILLIRSMSLTPLDVLPLRIEHNSPKGPAIELEEFRKGDALIADVFLNAEEPKDMDWKIVLQTKNPNSSSQWEGPATEINTLEPVASQIKKVD